VNTRAIAALILTTLGAAAILAGAAMIYGPVAFILAGVGLAALGLFGISVEP